MIDEIMTSNVEKIRKEIDSLINDGYWLLIGLYNEMERPVPKAYIRGVDSGVADRMKKSTFRGNYQKWYNASLVSVKQLLPDRLNDFVSAYRQDVKREKTIINFGIEDYLLGLSLTAFSEEKNQGFILSKFMLQCEIVRSLLDRLDSSLFEMRQMVEADFFDSEVEAADMLAKRGFYRSAGALCGVVLEKHLKEVAASHGLKVPKKTPCISDLNELLKNHSVIDVAQWRHMQYLGDLRNLCDHDKHADPTKEQVTDLIAGVRKVLKTVY